MKIHYYLDWFNDRIPDKIAKLLDNDIMDRKSLVMISADPLFFEGAEIGITERSWLDQANIIFDEYHIIDYDIQKKEAQRLVRNASVIFLLGGYTIEQNALLNKYELPDLIRKGEALVMGTSAGAINMTSKWLCSKNDGYDVEESSIYDGMGLNNFSFQPHLNFENTELFMNELLPLSKEMDIYMADQGAVRVKEGKIDIIGNVHLMSNAKMQKLDETL
jgi:cyanophycinase